MSMQVQFVIFWLAIIFILFIGLIQNKFSRKNQLVIVLFFIFFISYIYSYRTLGLDLRNYVKYYLELKIEYLMNDFSLKKIFISEYEPLFTLIAIISKKNGLSVQMWLFITVIIPSMMFYFSFFKKGKKPLLVFFFFILIMMFQIDLTRFYLASSFLCIAFHSKNLIKKGFFYVIAFGFHYSVIFLVFIEIFFIIKVSPRKKNGLIFFFVLGIFVLKNIDLSFLEYSQYRFLFKLWYNLYYSSMSDISMNFYQKIMIYVVNIYPIIMCMILLKIMKKDKLILKDKNYLKYKEALKIGIISNILLLVIFGKVRIGFRILLLTYFILFIPFSNSSEEKIYNGKIRGNTIKYIVILFIYNVIMSMYYVLISIIY